MLQVAKKKSDRIHKVLQTEQCLFLESEKGTIRIWPQSERIIRVSYTENGIFSCRQGEEFSDISGSCVWGHEEDGRQVRVFTNCLWVIIQKETGSIRYEDRERGLLLKETDKLSKTVEEFDSYKLVVNEQTVIDEIQTADGKKKVVRFGEKVFDKKLYHTKISFDFQQGEALYGLGQSQEGLLDLRGSVQYLHQGNMKIAVPMLVSSRKYGVLLSTQSAGIFRDDIYGSYFYTEGDEMLDYYFIAGGSLDEVVAGYRKLTGRAALLPRWAFGYIQSRERYETEEEIEKTAENFRSRHFGLDALVLDWMSWEGELWGQKTFDQERFPDPPHMIEGLHQRKVRFMMSVWPNMTRESENYQEFEKAGLLLPASEIYDAFSERGRSMYWDQLRKGLYCHGVDGWWCDSCEPVCPEWNHMQKQEPGHMYQEYVDIAGKYMPLEKINAYGLYHAKGIYEEQRAEGREQRVVNLIRSGYAGSQRYGAILWSGDISASWETLKNQVAAGLNFCVCGLPWWTVDIGGFFVKQGEAWYWNGEYENGTADDAYKELYVRWFQLGAFLPVFRSHGTDFYREPWYFGEPGDRFYDALLAANRERYRLMPYIYSVAGYVWHNNETMMRLLAFDFPEDEQVLDIRDQYMFGKQILVCPVLEPMYAGEGLGKTGTEKKRRVYLPRGARWYDYWTHVKYEGGQYVEAAAPLDRILLFVREGAVIPVTEPRECTADMDGMDITLEIYSGADGSFSLYEDAGDGYGYERGEYCITEITWRNDSRKVEWKSTGDISYRKGTINWQIIHNCA